MLRFGGEGSLALGFDGPLLGGFDGPLLGGFDVFAGGFGVARGFLAGCVRVLVASSRLQLGVRRVTLHRVMCLHTPP